MASGNIINNSIGFEEYQLPIPKEVSGRRGNMVMSTDAVKKIAQFQLRHNL